MATGAAQSYFGHDEFSVHALCLSSIDDALEVRRRILGAFEMAEGGRRGRAAWLTFGRPRGPTGVEMAGQIAELARQSLRENFRRIDPAEARWPRLDRLARPDGVRRGVGAHSRDRRDTAGDRLDRVAERPRHGSVRRFVSRTERRSFLERVKRRKPRQSA